METLGLTFRDVARIYGRGIPCEQPAQVGDHAEALVVQAELARQRADVPAPQAVAA
jgi:hypothetical protein